MSLNDFAPGVPAPMAIPRSTSRFLSWRLRDESVRGCHAFLRMPSCQISFSIDGLALGVATAIVERT
jgi:hypothetical protein